MSSLHVSPLRGWELTVGDHELAKTMNLGANAENAPKAATGFGVLPVSGRVQFDGFNVDFDRGELEVDGHVVPLRPKTFALLTCLVASSGRLLGKAQIMKAVWPGVVVTDDSLVQCVSELRASLGLNRQSLIRTVPRRGYMLDAIPLGASDNPVDCAEGISIPGMAPAVGNDPFQVKKKSWTWKRLPSPAAFVLMVLTVFALGSSVWQHWRADSRTHTGERRSMVVLPFENESGDPAQQLFVDGISSDVISDLSRLPDTLVIAQPSLRRTSPDEPQKSNREQARFVVTGSVLRSGEELRINVRLSSADNNAVLFSDTLVYGPERPWSWRQDIAPRVAHALDIRLTDVVGGWTTQAPRPRDSVEHTLRGFSLLRRAVLRPEFDKAGNEFASAIKTDPASASAWAGLSMSRSALILMRYVTEPTTLLEEAESAALRALSLDSSVPNAHYAYGQVLLLRGNLDAALQAFERVLQLNPSATFAHVRVAIILIEKGRAPEAIEHARMALRRSPYDATLVPLAHFAVGMALFHIGRDEEAYAEMQKMVAADPRVGYAYQWMAAIDALHGRPGRARENLSRYRELIAVQTIQGLKATERSSNPVFLKQRERFYEGLRLAGLSER